MQICFDIKTVFNSDIKTVLQNALRNILAI